MDLDTIPDVLVWLENTKIFRASYRIRMDPGLVYGSLLAMHCLLLYHKLNFGRIHYLSSALAMVTDCSLSVP